MKTAEASIYLDSLRPKKNGKCSVKVRISFNRTRKYYSTGIEVTAENFESIMNAKRRTSEQKEIYFSLSHLQNKATKAIKELSVFTYDAFEQKFLEQRNTHNSVFFAFDKYINELKSEARLGTASSFECAKNSLETFKKGLTFAEINPTFLRKYEQYMVANKKSISTVGIYLRSLRVIYNLQGIDKSLYPFGDAKDKYCIPTSRNIKKALTVQEISLIYNYEAPAGSVKEMAKDYWLFLYLCNGMNVKDLCLLKWGNINDKMLTYVRAKTVRSRKEVKAIQVALKPETLEIIRKWGVPSLSKEAYIFPHLNHKMTAAQQQATYKQVTKQINKYIRKITSELKINSNVTTYFARHSFATVLKRSGAKIEMISELLGHSSVDVTESYLDSFEKEQIQKETDALTAGFSIAKQF